MNGNQEFPKGSGVKIRVIDNKTAGEAFGQSFIVTLPGRLTGNGRERRQFRTLQQAKDFAAESVGGIRAIGEKFIDLEHADRDAALRLLGAIKERGGQPQDVVDDILAALQSLGTSPVRLNESVVFALPRLAPKSGIVTVAEAAESFKQAKTGNVGDLYLRTLSVQLDRIVEAFGAIPISHLDSAKITDFIGGFKKRDGTMASPKFRKHVLGALAALVRHAVSRGWMEKGIVDFDVIDRPKQPKGGAIHYFSAAEVEALLAHCDADLLPFIAIGAFSGLRSMEIERLDWRDVHLAQGHIEVTALNAKTGARRLAYCPPNLRRWLSPIAQKEGRVFPISTAGGNLTMRLQALAKRAGLETWRKNGLRHSFISHRVATIKNVDAVALECGNSASLIFSNYRKVVKPAAAKKYFGIVPKVAANVTPLRNAV